MLLLSFINHRKERREEEAALRFFNENQQTNERARIYEAIYARYQEKEAVAVQEHLDVARSRFISERRQTRLQKLKAY